MDTSSFAETRSSPGSPLLLLFHGTGGDEHQFMGVGQQLLPGAHLIAPRGDVSENGALRYFRRKAEGVFDMDDLARATDKMAGFIQTTVDAMQPGMVAAMGYSNGANILASILFAHPALIDRAVLMHPLIPFAPAPQPGLAGMKVLVTAGRRDPIGPAATTEALIDWFTAQGAEVTPLWHDGGHELRQEEMLAARDFLSP
ncbi:MAG: alpha/beta hydrolase [Devosia sp.]